MPPCNSCGSKFSTLNALKDHQEAKKHCYCYICHRHFQNDQAAEQHRSVLHNYVCLTCNKVFSQLGSLEAHQMAKQHSCCSSCRKYFYSDEAAEQHRLALHHNQCTSCNKVFVELASLIAHQKDKQHFYCPFCEMYFDSDQAAKNHQLKRNTRKCPSCESTFCFPEPLAEHKRSTGHCYCADCDRTFCNQDAIWQHLSSSIHAPEVSQYHCCDCDQDFVNETALNKHLKYKCRLEQTPKSEWFCAPCDREFLNQDALAQHLASLKHHPLSDIKCIGGKKCNRRFTSPSALLHHLESGACRASGLSRKKLNKLIRAADVERVVTCEKVSPSQEEILKSLGWDDKCASSETSGSTIYTPITDDNSISAPFLAGGGEDEGVGIWTPESQSPTTIPLRCPLCPPTRKPFKTHSALTSHLSSPAHDPKSFHCPLMLLTLPTITVTTATDTATANNEAIPTTTTMETDPIMKTQKQFSTFSGLTQHIESGACKGGKNIFKEAIRFLEIAGWNYKSWPLPALSRGFQSLITQASTSTKLCLFIDGLDEYEGDETEIARLFGGAASKPNIKICASSRPHKPFENKFVSDRLVNDEKMQQLTLRELIASSSLINEIVTTADGVFLWVKLVVTSLLRGLGDDNRISDLQKRLRALPPKLTNLYKHMVLNVDNIYKEDASRFFQLIDASQARPNDWDDLGQFTILTLAMAMEEDQDLALKAKANFLSTSEMVSKCKEMEVRLRTRCGGLLEVQLEDAKSDKVTPNMSVTYLHRTVRDFLVEKQTRAALVDWTGGTAANAFNANVALMNANLLRLKLVGGSKRAAIEFTNGVLAYARRCEAEKFPANVKFLDEFWRIGGPLLRQYTTALGSGDIASMMSLATQCGLNSYLRSKLASNKDLLHLQSGRSLLDIAINPKLERWAKLVSSEVVATLLKFGANPNEKFLRRSPWQNVLSYIFSGVHDPDILLPLWADIIKMLLKYKADGLALFPECCKILTAKDVIAMTFAQHPALEAELQKMLSQNITLMTHIRAFFDRRRLEKSEIAISKAFHSISFTIPLIAEEKKACKIGKWVDRFHITYRNITQPN
ncbi:MAG: hypothetical protein M1834_007098 [Cirrosporium novae-zelandiae]|nr:MAG: hypothetical protein M1834_007098 [Cirrosporium novae-zelandiae]